MNKISVDRICRTCMSGCDKTEQHFKSIQSTLDADGRTSILDILNIIVSKLHIEPTDNLPQQVCNGCVNKLEIIIQFQEMCILSDDYFRGVVQKFYMKQCSSVDESKIPPTQLTPSNDVKASDPLNTVVPILQSPDIIHNEKKIQTSCRKLTEDNKEDSNVKPFSSVETNVPVVSLNLPDMSLNDAINSQGREHGRSDNGKVKVYPCKTCEKTFSCQQAVNAHSQVHNELGKHFCNICNKPFLDEIALRNHVRRHKREKEVLCFICGKTFGNSQLLNSHTKRHNTERRYECADCPKKFKCSTDLTSHKLIHRKEKPHGCDICGKRFRAPNEVKLHKMYHNGERPHKCDYCDVRFIDVAKKKVHMRTHTGEKPYQCKHCERAFAQCGDLKKHLRLHLGKNIYKCELCTRTFPLVSEMRLHYADHKKDRTTMETKLNELGDVT